MDWVTPEFEEMRMDAEARAYGNWLDEGSDVPQPAPEAVTSQETPSE